MFSPHSSSFQWTRWPSILTFATIIVLALPIVYLRFLICLKRIFGIVGTVGFVINGHKSGRWFSWCRIHSHLWVGHWLSEDKLLVWFESVSLQKVVVVVFDWDLVRVLFGKRNFVTGALLFFLVSQRSGLVLWVGRKHCWIEAFESRRLGMSAHGRQPAFILRVLYRSGLWPRIVASIIGCVFDRWLARWLRRRRHFDEWSEESNRHYFA